MVLDEDLKHTTPHNALLLQLHRKDGEKTILSKTPVTTQYMCVIFIELSILKAECHRTELIKKLVYVINITKKVTTFSLHHT